MKKMLVLMLLVFLVGSILINMFNPVSSLSSEPVDDFWTAKTHMSQARGGLGVVALDGKIYAIGGKTVEGFVGTSECYDPKTDTWTTLEPMPTPRAYFAAVAYQDKIYCIGGLNNGGLCSVNEVYDVILNSWSVGTVLPVKGKDLQGHVVGGQIFVIAGYDLFMYDPLGDVWIQKCGVPKNVFSNSNFVASAVIDDDIIVTCKSKTVIYNCVTDIWHERSGPSVGLSNGVSGATTGVCAPKKVYTIGTVTTKEEWWDMSLQQLQGSGSEGQVSPGYVASISPVVVVYDPVSGAWSDARAGLNRVDFGIAVVDDVLYVVGGYMIVFGETVVSVDVREFVAGVTYWGTYRVVSRQLVAQESVVGAPCAFNWQYVPVGYSATDPTVTDVAPNTREDSEFEFSSNILLIAISALIVSVATVGIFFYFQKKHT